MWFRKKKIPQKEKEELFSKIKEALLDEFSFAPEKITLSTRFREDLAFNSLETIQTTMALEEAFDLEIPDEDMEKVFTIDDAISYLYRRIEEGK